MLLAFVATVYAGKLPEPVELKPDAEAEPKQAAAAEQTRDKRGILLSPYSAPYAAAYSYPAYTASYSYPYAYSAPYAIAAYRSAYYPSYYSSYVLGWVDAMGGI